MQAEPDAALQRAYREYKSLLVRCQNAGYGNSVYELAFKIRHHVLAYKCIIAYHRLISPDKPLAYFVIELETVFITDFAPKLPAEDRPVIKRQHVVINHPRVSKRRLNVLKRQMEAAYDGSHSCHIAE